MPGVTDPSEAYFKDGQWGWDGTVWRKLPMVWGYSERWVEHEENLTPAAGVISLSFDQVGSGYIYVLQAADGWNAATDPSRIQFQVEAGGIIVRLAHTVTPGLGIPAFWTGEVVLKKDDRLVVRFYGTVAGDDLHANAWGYKMKIAE